MKLFKKVKDKNAATTLVEILIVTPILLVIMFYGVGIYHLVQQQTYIEDVKFRMIQEMSRQGELTAYDIDNRWSQEFERMNGVRYVSITPVSKTSLGELMTTDITLRVTPSIFPNLLGGEYTTRASIYSEEG